MNKSLLFLLFMAAVMAACHPVKSIITIETNTKDSTAVLSLSGSGKAVIEWGDGTRKETVQLHELPADGAFFSHQKRYIHPHSYTANADRTITVRGVVSGLSTHLLQKVTAIDVSRMPTLQVLNCSDREIDALDLTKNPVLRELDCAENLITVLDVSANPALTALKCGKNVLTALDVSKNPALTELRCDSNRLTAIDVSKNTALKTLNITDNEIATLDVQANPALLELFCGNNQLTSLDVRKNTQLVYLSIYSNSFSAPELHSICSDLLTHTDKSERYFWYDDNPGSDMLDEQKEALEATGWSVNEE